MLHVASTIAALGNLSRGISYLALAAPVACQLLPFHHNLVGSDHLEVWLA